MTNGCGVGEEWPAPGVLLSMRFRLAEKLAISGMSEIWRADDQLLGRPVAIKLPRPQAVGIVHQAWTEARTTARLSHPNIAAVHDYGEALRPDGSVAPYVVMELLDGGTLADRLAGGPLAWPEAARIGAGVASGLAAAHARRVVHRDIKPGNIMLTPTGTKILDFGISAAIGAPDDDETGSTFGTPAYVAPERLNGTPADPATDMYALGTVLFEMVNGEPPYPVDNWEEFAAARQGPPGRLPQGLPAAFRDLVERCLADDPRLRPEAAEVRDQLAALRPPKTSPQAPPGSAAGRAPAHTLALARRPTPTTARMAAVVLLLLAAGAVVGLRAWSTDDNRTPTAAPSRSDPSQPAVPTSPPGPAAEPTIGLNATVDSIISAVRAGQAAGRIRPDVAVDLINLLRQLDDAPPEDISRRVAELQQKIRDRINEGALDRTYADELHTRLDGLARA